METLTDVEEQEADSTQPEAEEPERSEDKAEQPVAPKGKRKGVRRAIVAAIVVIVVAIGTFAGYSVYNGDLAPFDAAAKYNGLNYLPESEVSDYIGVYLEQMELADASDEDLATFYAAYNLTPSRLRYSTINQLIKDKLVDQKAQELGLSATEEEIDATVATLRDSLGLGDEEILLNTLAAHGQTMEGLREVYRQAIVRRLVLSAEVPTPTPTDDQVKEYMTTFNASLSDSTVKHSYCFRLVGLDEGGSRDRISRVQDLRNQFLEGEHTESAFATLVKAYSNDDQLVADSGANGWNVDESDYSDNYVEALAELGEDGVSNVFIDGDAYAFIWVNDTYELPTSASAIDSLDPDAMPSSLWQFFSDSAAYELWEETGQAYIEQLLDDADVVYYPMPNDVPYNVDMSLADVQLEEVDADSGSAADAELPEADVTSSR